MKNNIMNKQITELTDIELKALAYDELGKLQLAQNNIKVLNDELYRRSQQTQTNLSQAVDSNSPV